MAASNTLEWEVKLVNLQREKEALAKEKEEMEGQMKFMRDQLRELTLTVQRQRGDLPSPPISTRAEDSDEGECLVVRRTLNNHAMVEENLQREATFHTRCTVSNKVCSLIIDGGSCTNVASQTLINKLNLPVEVHPTPYIIQWLNQGKGIHVTHRVLLSFSIGNKYEDEIWCDVVPTDACHVLLGRPWLFDRRVMHDGF